MKFFVGSRQVSRREKSAIDALQRFKPYLRFDKSTAELRVNIQDDVA